MQSSAKGIQNKIGLLNLTQELKNSCMQKANQAYGENII